MITVDYIADENGYRETRKEEPGFVQIRALPVQARTEVIEPAPAPVRSILPRTRTQVVQPAPAPIRRTQPSVQNIVKAVEPIVAKVVKEESGDSDSDLVARIISQLTPFIRNTVSSSLGSSSRRA